MSCVATSTSTVTRPSCARSRTAFMSRKTPLAAATASTTITTVLRTPRFTFISSSISSGERDGEQPQVGDVRFRRETARLEALPHGLETAKAAVVRRDLATHRLRVLAGPHLHHFERRETDDGVLLDRARPIDSVRPTQRAARLHLLLGVVDREEQDLVGLCVDVVCECAPLEAAPPADVLGRRVDEERARIAARDRVGQRGLAA